MCDSCTTPVAVATNSKKSSMSIQTVGIVVGCEFFFLSAVLGLKLPCIMYVLLGAVPLLSKARHSKLMRFCAQMLLRLRTTYT